MHCMICLNRKYVEKKPWRVCFTKSIIWSCTQVAKLSNFFVTILRHIESGKCSHYLFQSCLGSSMQLNTIKCIEQREGGTSQRWQRPGLWARNKFRILTNILFPVKSFKIAARTFRVPWLVGSSHYSPITTLPYHYNTFLARHIWPVPVSGIGGRSFY